MKKSDSRECRNCHNFEYMDFTMQEDRAASEHQRALDEGMTCIDCHQGIAQKLPEGYQEEYSKILETHDAKQGKGSLSATLPGNDIRSYLDRTDQ